MATLTALYTRIILDLNRDDMGSGGDLEQAKIDAVADAVEFYSDEQFWFNRASGTASTVASTATVALPTGVRLPTVVSYLGEPLRQVPLDRISEVYNATTPLTGRPYWWAEDEGLIRLYPTPNAVYALSVYGLASTGVPAAGGDTNIWTTEALPLILARAKKILLRGPLRDPEGAALMAQAEDEALTKLRRETRRRGRSTLSTDLPAATGFNINTGD